MIIICHLQFRKEPKIPYWVLIHPTRETLLNDEASYRAVTMHATESKTVTLSKINLESISSKDNPCVSDDSPTDMVCRMEKVCSQYLNKKVRNVDLSI